MRRTRMLPALLLAVVAATMSARPAVGQELFKASQAKVDLSTYSNVFNCYAALHRVVREQEDKEFFATGIWHDTLPYDSKERFRPHPAIVRETALACVKSTAEDGEAALLDAWSIMAHMYLHAGMVDSARAVVDRRLNAVKPDSVDQLVPLFTQIGQIFHGKGAGGASIRPPIPEVGTEIILAHIGRLPTVDARLHVYLQMMVTAGEANDGDTESAAQMQRLRARLVAQLDSLTDDAAQGLADRGLIYDDMRRITPEKARERLEAMGSFYLGNFSRLEYLRESTEAYAEITRKVYGGATGNPPDAYPWPVGLPAPRLEGDIWLGCEQEPCESYPRQGRVSVVAYYTPETNTRRGQRPHGNEKVLPHLLTPVSTLEGCALKAAPLRHLQDKFPEIDIIVVSRTLGHYHYAKEEVTPEREAELLYECFKANGVDRVVVSMTRTPGFRLPTPDARLARRPEANWTNYSFSGIWTDDTRYKFGGDLIIDQNGDIITFLAGRIERWSEPLFTEAVRALLEREKART